MPDAAAEGWYSDWWNGGEGGPPKWETFHLVELRQLIERNWHAGDKRVIAGLSMGGYGAMEYAARQPWDIRRSPGHSAGSLDPLHGDVDGQYVGGPDDGWGDPVAQADVWKAHDPTTTRRPSRASRSSSRTATGKWDRWTTGLTTLQV